MATSLDSYAPFDSGAGANVTEGTWRNMVRHLHLGDGVMRNTDLDMEVFADSTGMQVKVKTGECWVRGHWGKNSAEKTLSIATAHATLARKDRVILRSDFINNRVELDVLTGTASGSPAAPSLTKSSSVWEVSLAIVDVPAADTSIDASQVTDDRTYSGAESRYYSTSNQSITASSETDLEFNFAAYRCADVVASGTNNKLFTVQRPGIWVVSVGIRFQGGTISGSGERLMRIYRGSMPIAYNGQFYATTAWNTLYFHGSMTWAGRLTTGDAIKATMFHVSTAAISTDVVSNEGTYITLSWIRQ